MEPLFVTSNPDKAREAAEILSIELRSIDLDLPELQDLDVAQVAAVKAAAAHETLGAPDSPILVEDSGFVIEAWNGLPGALTKWFLASVGNEGILKMLSGEENRSGRAVCAVAIAFADGATRVFLGEVVGSIASEPRGSGGFGWDPIFVPEGYSQTYAELGSRKHEDSHRARALRAAREAIHAGLEFPPPRGSRTRRAPLRGGRAFSGAGERGILHDKIVPPREKGAAVSAEENERTGDGGVETREESHDGGAVATDGEHLVELYKKMVLIRTFEEATQRAFRQGKIGGYLHVYIGQEAVATGFVDAYKEGDRVITAYRDHPFPLLLGSDPKSVMAELYGKGTGLVKGKGGSMHLFDVENGLYGGYGIVGGHIPLGVGFAYAMKYQDTDHICQLYLGDGAINNGAFHEAANLSGLWGRDGFNPCLWIVENNQYGMGTSVARSTAMTDLGAKFDAYGIEHEKVDGMDLEAVLEVAHRSTERVRETGQPYAVEALTYRTAPHGAADFFEKYRTKDEVKKWRQRDPIGQLEHKLLESEVLDEDALEEIRAEMKETMDEVTNFADESEEPSVEELYTDVYAGEDEYMGEE